MTLAAAADAPAFLYCQTEVARVERLSPSFVRVELASPALADFGVDGPTWDQRIKLVFDGDVMRTYTVRDVVGSGAETRVVVDLVVHGVDGAAGHAGPGSRWAAGARVGSRVGLLGPRRGAPWGGIEFAPPYDAELVLAGDETAVPAVLAILSQLDPDARGTAYLEVPTAADVQTAVHPEGVRVVWLPREGAGLGELLRAEVLGDLGATTVEDVAEADEDLWETPTYSSSGEDLDPVVRSLGGDLEGLYAWIAGESRVVTGLRRALVGELGLDRRQVAFMGYWREGVAMKG